MEKTEKSMTELNIEANEKLELDKITEAGKELTPLHGPGYVGLSNLGNSCYINSVLQVRLPPPSPYSRHLGTLSTSVRTSACASSCTAGVDGGAADSAPRLALSSAGARRGARVRQLLRCGAADLPLGAVGSHAGRGDAAGQGGRGAAHRKVRC